MYKKGKYVIYQRNVCKIIGIKDNCYILTQLDDPSLTIKIPIENGKIHLREIISKEQISNIINQIPKIPLIENNDKILKNEYHKLLNTGNHLDLVKIIKTTYVRNKERKDNKRKISDLDNRYFQLAEKYIYNEFAIALNKTPIEVKEYIINTLKSMENNNEK